MNLRELNREQKNIIVLFGISIVFWLSLVFYREYHKKDVKMMRQNILGSCNGWCFGHFIHYTLLSYCAPSYWVELIIIGFIFELIEVPLNSLSKYIDSKIYEDTITNTLGVLTGILLYKICPMNIDLISLMSK